jgi:predicted RNA-binding Zn-ribbon protein involved in translation (DUF1610 family)
MSDFDKWYAEQFGKVCPACGMTFVANAEVYPALACPGCGIALELECEDDGSNQRVYRRDPEILTFPQEERK